MTDPHASAGSGLGAWAIRHAKAVIFVTLLLCLAGAYAAWQMPSSIFPQTDFPRVVILVDNGAMPADEMMATITRPIEEAMKDIPGAESIRSATGRGSAEINVFFSWDVDMVQSELFVLGRLGQLRSALPATATSAVWRLTFSAFPILGISLTSEQRNSAELWEAAQYTLKPRFLRIPGVARVDLVGGSAPEYHVVVDPMRPLAAGLSLAQLSSGLASNNLISAAGFHEEDYTLYLTVVDGRVRAATELEALVVGVVSGQPIALGDVARVERAAQPVFNVVTADGTRAVLLNIRSQPAGSTLGIATALAGEVAELRSQLPPDVRLSFFYDQSQMVRASVDSVWEAIAFGLLLSVAIIYLFLRSWSGTCIAVVVIPVTVLVAIVAMRLCGLTFNLMTLGGIAAAVGLVIDDAIVVVEAIHVRLAAGEPRLAAIAAAIGDIVAPLVASTLTPVVVFLPLAFLVGLTGVFFRALAITMVVSLLTSLVLAVTVTPSLAGWFLRERASGGPSAAAPETPRRSLLGWLIRGYEVALRAALRLPRLTFGICVALLAVGGHVAQRLESDFLPAMDEGGCVIDYWTPWGTSLAETDRQLVLAEQVLGQVPEIESWSRRTGARLALGLTEPNRGDYLIKLRPDRQRSTEAVIDELRARFLARAPGIQWEFHGILGDLIGDLTWSPKPIEVKLFSSDIAFLKRKAPEIEASLKQVAGVVDTFDGLTMTGPSLSVRVRHLDARRHGLSADEIAQAVATAMFGRTASTILEGDRVLGIRVRVDAADLDTVAALRSLPLRTQAGTVVMLAEVADLIEVEGQLELRREDLRQDVAISARLEGRDLGSAMREIRERLAADPSLPPGAIEFGGLFQQQQESFRNLLLVLATAILLVFTVLLIEFRALGEPLAIVFGAVLALLGTVLALWVTSTTLNIISLLGAIIGVGIVAKNGILMLDCVAQLRAEGVDLDVALLRSGRRRLRPVLMTSLAAGLGMLPLAYGIGSGADMLKPLAIGVIGALAMSVVLSLMATPTVFYLLARSRRSPAARAEVPQE